MLPQAPKLPFPLVAAILLLAAIPGLIEQSRDVDVLLYMAAAARANAEGSLPYAAAWIEKGPLAMGLYQAIDALFGRYCFPAIALVWVALALSGTWLARALAREAGADWGAGWGALGFAVGIGAVGGTLNTEVPALVLAASALLVWCRGLRGRARGRRAGLLSGLLIGAAFLCRQNALALVPVLVGLEMWLVARGLRERREAVVAAGLIAAGGIAPFLATAVAYRAAGAWEPFALCFWSYNADVYVAATRIDAPRLARIPWDLAASFLWPVRTTAALGLVGAAGVLAAARGARAASRESAAGVAIAAAAAGSLVAMIPGLRFFTHYAAMALPFLAALAALGLEALARRAGARAGLVLVLTAFSLGLELAPAGWRDAGGRLIAWWERGAYRRLRDPIEWPGRDEGMVEAARLIRDRGAVEDRVFVWGMRPHVAVYADRLAATRFVTCTFLTGLVPWERVGPAEETARWIVPGSWDLLAADLARERPAWIVDASHDHLFGDGAYPPERFAPLASILARDYRRVLATGERDRLIVWQRVR